MLGRFREGEDKLDEAVTLCDRAVAIDSADVRPFDVACDLVLLYAQAGKLDLAKLKAAAEAKLEIAQAP